MPNPIYLHGFGETLPALGFLTDWGWRGYKLMIVADLDTNSREKDDKKGKWKSYLKKAELRCDGLRSCTIHWLEDQEIFTRFSEHI